MDDKNEKVSDLLCSGFCTFFMIVKKSPRIHENAVCFGKTSSPVFRVCDWVQKSKKCLKKVLNLVAKSFWCNFSKTMAPSGSDSKAVLDHYDGNP